MPYADPEKRRAYMKAYHSAHRDQLNAAGRENYLRCRAENPAAENARRQAWKLANPEKVRTGSKVYYSTPEGKLSSRIAEQRRRAHGREVGDGGTDAREYIVILAQDPCCYCGAPMEHIDHIIPLALCGDNSWENLTAACGHCNTSKGSKKLIDWMVM